MISRFIHLTDFKIPPTIFILFLKLFLGVAIVPSALSQEGGRKFPLQSLNAVHDAVKDLLINETNAEIKQEILFLHLKLEEKILSDSLSLAQIIDILIENVSDRESSIYKQVISLQLIEALLTKYSPSDPEILKIVGMLIEVLPSGKLENELHFLYLKFLEKILQKFVLPERVILSILYQIEENLFYANVYIEEIIIRIIGQILIKVSDPVREGIILWLEGLLKDTSWKKRLSALLILSYFLKQDLLSNPDDRRRVIFMVRDRVNDEHWRVQEEAIETSAMMLIQEDVLLDPNERRDIALMIRDQINDENWGVKKLAIKTSGMLLIQGDILSDPDDRREVVRMIKNRINDEDWGVQEEAIKTSAILLSREDILPDFNERREVALIIKDKAVNKNWNGQRDNITDKDWKPQKAAIKALGILLSQEDVLFNLTEIRDIAFLMMDQTANPLTKGIRGIAVSVLGILLIRQDLLPDLNDRKEISIRLLQGISDKNLSDKKKAIDTLNTLFNKQPILFNFNDREQIALVLHRWLVRKDWVIQEAALKLSDTLLDYKDISFSQQSKIYFKIAGFDF